MSSLRGGFNLLRFAPRAAWGLPVPVSLSVVLDPVLCRSSASSCPGASGQGRLVHLVEVACPHTSLALIQNLWLLSEEGISYFITTSRQDNLCNFAWKKSLTKSSKATIMPEENLTEFATLLFSPS